MLEAGLKGVQTLIVTPEVSAKVMGSGALDVFATPAMIMLMEKTAWSSVQSELEEGCGTVGTRLEIDHLAASPIGMEIRCESELTAVEGRKLTFKVECYDSKGLVGQGKHERFIVQNEKFQARANSKL